MYHPQSAVDIFLSKNDSLSRYKYTRYYEQYQD